MTKPVWSNVLALSAWTLKNSYIQFPGSLSPDYKYLHASNVVMHVVMVTYSLYEY